MNVQDRRAARQVARLPKYMRFWTSSLVISVKARSSGILRRVATEPRAIKIQQLRMGGHSGVCEVPQGKLSTAPGSLCNTRVKFIR